MKKQKPKEYVEKGWCLKSSSGRLWLHTFHALKRDVEEIHWNTTDDKIVRVERVTREIDGKRPAGAKGK